MLLREMDEEFNKRYGRHFRRSEKCAAIELVVPNLIFLLGDPPECLDELPKALRRKVIEINRKLDWESRVDLLSTLEEVLREALLEE